MNDDLYLLFGDSLGTKVHGTAAPPEGPGLEPTLEVEIAPGRTARFESASEARDAVASGRPRHLPRITKRQQIYYWTEFDPATSEWLVIEYSHLGFATRARFATSSEAWLMVRRYQQSAAYYHYEIEDLGPRPRNKGVTS